MFIIVLIGAIFLAREMAGYDSRYNTRKYFVLNNKQLAKILLPKRISVGRSSVKRSKADFNKMTYLGAVFYGLNLLIIMLIPIFLLLVPEIKLQPLEIENNYVFVNTLNQKILFLCSCLLIAVEVAFMFLYQFVKAKMKNQKWMMVLSFIMVVLMALCVVFQINDMVLALLKIC